MLGPTGRITILSVGIDSSATGFHTIELVIRDPPSEFIDAISMAMLNSIRFDLGAHTFVPTDIDIQHNAEHLSQPPIRWVRTVRVRGVLA